MVTKLNRKSLKEQKEVGSPQCAGKESGSLRSRSQCPSVCRMSTLLLGHMSNSDPDVANELLTLHLAESGFGTANAISCHAGQILPFTSEPIAPLRISSSLILLWLRPTRGFSFAFVKLPTSYHVFLLASNTVPLRSLRLFKHFGNEFLTNSGPYHLWRRNQLQAHHDPLHSARC